MKRSKPLHRGGGLKRRKELRAAKGLAPGGPLERRTPLKGGKPLRTKRPERTTEVARRMQEDWKREVMKAVPRDKGGLLVCPVCGKHKTYDNFEAHHVVEQARLKVYVRSLRLAYEESLAERLRLLWDKRNGLGLCRTCHRAHTRRIRKIPRACLNRLHFAFAREVGLDYLLDRDYE